MAEITRTFDLLDHLVEHYPKDDILAGKVNGEWVKYSSHDYYKFAHYLAYGLCEMGFTKTWATEDEQWIERSLPRSV
jgi:long-chain acyl-CoA synthetase